jgi:hypothetical protein
MKTRAIVASVFLAANLIPQAMACGRPSGGLDGTQVALLLGTSGRIACYGAPPIWNNQEIHLPQAGASGGALRDYKMGPHSPTDPTRTIGTYSIATTPPARTGIITYSYEGGQAFAYFIAPVSGTAPAPPTPPPAGLYYFFPNANGIGSACTFMITVHVETSAASGCT